MDEKVMIAFRNEMVKSANIISFLSKPVPNFIRPIAEKLAPVVTRAREASKQLFPSFIRGSQTAERSVAKAAPKAMGRIGQVAKGIGTAAGVGALAVGAGAAYGATSNPTPMPM
jgi:hypothetical protein